MPNGLIDDLFRPNGPLQITPGGYSHLLQLANFHIAEQPYVMVDHGTFVAGIIHAIAPQAQLQLIEVLNPLGVGTLETIVRGFQTLADNRTVEGQIADTPPLVVNLSLVLTVPTPGLLEELAQQDPAFQGVDPDALEATILSIKNICDMLRPHNVYFVAAAGNDSDAVQGTLLEADFPAALDNVIGVGALDRNDAAASYSNIGDRTPEVGFAAFGGVRDASGDADAVDGILGVYTGTFPNGEPNNQGLARWAGTSFAAPIISGALAAMLGDTIVHPDPVQELRDSDIQGLLSIGEIVHAQQG
jgi:Subtilase family